MRRKLRIAVLILVVLGVGLQFAPTAERDNPPSTAGLAMSDRVRTPPEVAAILRRACYDCHSNETVWPWYSRVNPVAWFVIDHVHHARSHLNFSEWPTNVKKEPTPDQLLGGICTETREGFMPLGSYLLLHRAARLSAADVDTLCAWTKEVRGK